MVSFRRLLVSLCLIPVCFAQHTPRKIIDLPIPGSDGKIIRVSQYSGKVLMIEMFLTDCPECLKTLEFMGRLQQEYGPRGFQAIGISLDGDPAAVKPFVDRYRFPFPVGHLGKEQAVKFLELNESAHPVVPYLLYVDWMGNIRFQYAGNDPVFSSGEKNLRAIADGLLRQAKEKKGAQLETRPAGKQ
jgi:peroxiredoxin